MYVVEKWYRDDGCWTSFVCVCVCVWFYSVLLIILLLLCQCIHVLIVSLFFFPLSEHIAVPGSSQSSHDPAGGQEVAFHPHRLHSSAHMGHPGVHLHRGVQQVFLYQ